MENFSILTRIFGKRTYLVSLFAFLLLLAAFFFFNQETPSVSAAFPGWVNISAIYVDSSQDDPINKFLLQAARELKLHLEKVAGKTFAISSDNRALGKTNITASVAADINYALLSALTDGVISSSPYIGLGSGSQWIQLDLEELFLISRINIRHYYQDGRAYRDVISQLSEDGTNWVTVFNNDANNGAGQGTGTDLEYQETAGGKDIILATSTKARYIKSWTNGSTANAGNHYVELEVYGEPVVTSTTALGIYLKVDPNLPEFATRNEEAFKLFSDANGITITGKTPIAVRHGAYALLEKLGFRWYWSNPVWYVTPDSLANLELNEIQEPGFIQRGIGIGIGQLVGSQNGTRYWSDWQKRNRMGGAGFYSAQHSWPNFAERSSVMAEDPTAVCYKPDGISPQQSLPDHPVVINRALNYARNYFNTPPGADLYTGQTLPKMSVPISPPDGNMIWCDEWRVAGSYSGQVITDKVFGLTNETAKMLQREYPGKYASVLSYSWYSEIPSYQLEPNVYVQVTDFSRGTSLSTKERLEKFKQTGVLTGFYGYFDVWPWWKDRIDPPGKYWGKHFADLKMAAETRANIFYVEGSDNWGPKGRLYWVTSHYTWNPNQTIDSLLDDFYANAFGPASSTMKRYYERFDTQPHTDRVYGLAFQNLKEAMQLAAGNEKVLERIRQVFYHTYFWWRWGDNVKAGYTGFTDVNEAKEMYNFLYRIRDFQLVTFRSQEESLRPVLQNTYGLTEQEIKDLQMLQIPASGDACPLGAVQCRTQYPSTPPTPAEATAWLEATLATFSGIDLVDVQILNPIDFQPFVPAGSNLPSFGRHTGGRGTLAEVLIPSPGSETVTVSLLTTDGFEWIDPQGKLLLKESLTNLCATGGCCYSCAGKVYELPAALSGVYKLRVLGWHSFQVPNRPASIAGPSFGYWTGYSTYFYVPLNYTVFIAGVDSGPNSITLTAPNGATYNFSGEKAVNEWVVRDPVPGVWKIDMTASGLGGNFWLYGIPPLIWYDPQYLLAPASTAVRQLFAVSSLSRLYLFQEKDQLFQVSGSNFSTSTNLNLHFLYGTTTALSLLLQPKDSSTIETNLTTSQIAALPIGFYDLVLERISDSYKLTYARKLLITKLGDLWSQTATETSEQKRDGKIDIYDASRMLSKWGSSQSSDLAEADINSGPGGISAGRIDLYDANLMMRNWNP